MTPLEFSCLVALASYAAGLLGSLVGVGGGIIIVPLLTLLLGVDIHHAIAASIISVIATSSGAASAYVREHLSNLRLAMFLEIATSAGALSGAFLAGVISPRCLFVLFGLALIFTASSLGKRKAQAQAQFRPDPLADRLKLHAAFYDPAVREEISYRVSRTKAGFLGSYVAGVVSALLGVGGGIVKVPLMNLVMGMPIKACSATSNFMIGVTAATSAAVYFAHGQVRPFIAAPVSIGVLLGARSGPRLMNRLKSDRIRIIFVIVLGIAAIQMLVRGFK